MSEQTSREQRFIGYLKQLHSRGDRGALAALRRAASASPVGVLGADRYIVPWLPREPSPWRDACYYLVAGLFARHPTDWPPATGQSTNFGASFACLGRDKESVLSFVVTDMPARFDVAKGDVRAAGILVDVDEETGSALTIRRFFWKEGQPLPIGRTVGEALEDTPEEPEQEQDGGD